MKKTLWISILIILSLFSGCATTNQASIFNAQDIYRSSYLAFYKKVQRSVLESSQGGRLRYDEEAISRLYQEMVNEIQAQYDASGLDIKVNALNTGEWGWMENKSYLSRLDSTIEKLTSRYRKEFLDSRAMAPNITAAFLLTRGWDISQNGFARQSSSGETYSLPLLITVAVADVYGYQWHFQLNTKGLRLISQFMEKTTDKKAREAEISAINWDFTSADTLLAETSAPSKTLKGFIENQKALERACRVQSNRSLGDAESAYSRVATGLDWIDRNKFLIKALIN